MVTSSPLIPSPPPGDVGRIPVTRPGDPVADTGIDFALVRLRAGEAYEPSRDHEGALLLLAGEVRFEWEGGPATRTRPSLFDDAPVALHFPRATAARAVAGRGCELAAFAVESDGAFAPQLFDGESLVENDHRGRGLLDDTAYRLVRTIFDRRNRPTAALVLGEVVSLPGRWSSYPPHHHRQPEIYHYRFTEPQGYGHGELGERVFKIRHGDTLAITGEQDHAQVAAPGYGMYYLWVIRHLPGDPYTAPEFTAEHRWLLDPGSRVWRPKLPTG